MKKLLFLLLAFSFASLVNGQFIWNDFDANQNVPFTGGNPDPTIIANPHSGGINTSPNVAEWIRGGWDWSHAKATAPGTIDFNTGTVFTLKVYSPIVTTVLFKLEGPGGTTEVSQPVGAGAWELLSFDFTGAPNDAFNTIVIFFAPATGGSTDTYYFDDVVGPGYTTVVPKPYIAAKVQDNFENDGWGTIDDWKFQDPDMNPLGTTVDPVDPANTVVDYNRSGAFPYTNAQAELNHRMDLNERNIFELKVYFPSSNNYTGSLTPTAALKLQNSLLGGNAWTTQVEIVETITTFDSWVTLTYDFSGAFDRTDLDQIVVQLGGEGHNEVAQFYFDDLELLPVVYPTPAYIYNDFDANQNEEFFGDPVMPVLVANPDPTGMNTSANCMEILKDQADWAYVYTELDELINFSNGTNFQMKVWSDTICQVTFKLENRFANWISTERTAMITETDEWVLLNFDFAGEASERYSKIVIFFGFAETMGYTFYFDDVEGPVYDTPKLVLEEDIQENFENDGWSTVSGWLFEDPDAQALPVVPGPVNPSNDVADYERDGSFQWTNAQVELDHRIDLTERNEFELEVYFPSSNNYSTMPATASMKLQNSLYVENAWWTQTEVVLPVTVFDEWVTLLFDFEGVSTNTDYDKIVIQLGGEGHNEPAQFYFDDLYLKHIPYVTVESPNGGEQIDQGAAFEIEWDYNWWEGDIKIELQKGQQTPQTIVYNLPASDSSYIWTVMTNQEPGDDYRVIITSLDNDFPTDTSDANFSIMEVTGVNASFSADPTNLTEGDSTMFTDMSGGDPTSWEWEFEGGTPATFSGQQPPYIVYSTAGVYDVTLTISDGTNNDVLLIEDYITVGALPVADFEGTPTQLYAGEYVDFTNLSTGGVMTYEWYFEGGTPETSTEENPTGIVYSTAGLFDVQLTVTDEYGSTTTIKEDYIDAMPVGIDEIEATEISIFPNPATEQIHISGVDNMESLKIYSVSGVEVLSIHGFVNEVNVAGLQNGIYIINVITNEGGSISSRFIKK